MLERIYFNTEDQIELVGLLETPDKPTNKVIISLDCLYIKKSFC